VFDSDDWPTAQEYMLDLQHAALEVDAVPGLTSGLHVHVDKRRLERAGLLHTALVEYCKWERTLADIAAGRWARVRPGQNSTVRSLPQAEGIDFHSALDSQLYEFMFHDADRHYWLSVRTRHKTWEFRLWNSTRAAWRMEMFARLSIAFTEPDFVRVLAGTLAPRNVSRLAELLDDHDERAAQLVRRQLTYIETVAPTVSEEVA